MTDHPWTIRDAAPGDHAGWLELWQGYNAFYGRIGADALPAEITALTWARFLDPAEPMQALLAVERERVLGLAHCIATPCWRGRAATFRTSTPRPARGAAASPAA